MKGIRKVFLGLVFLTLFSVGFKVDVKAVDTYVGWVDGTASHSRVDNFSSAWGVGAYADLEDSSEYSDFPSSTGSTENEITLHVDIWSGPETVTVKTRNDPTGGKQYRIEPATTWTNYSDTTKRVYTKTNSKTDLRDYVAGSLHGKMHTYKIGVNSSSGQPFNVRVYQVTPHASYGGSTTDAPDVSFSDSLGAMYTQSGTDKAYLFEGESDTFTATLDVTMPRGMKAGYWLNNSKTATSTTTTNPYTLTAGDVLGGFETSIYADYLENGTIQFTPSFENTYLAEGFRTNQTRKIKFVGNTYTGNNISSLKFKHTGGDISVVSPYWGSGSEAILHFIVPAGVGTGVQTLIIEMDDNFVYEVEVNIVNPSIELAPATNNITVGETSTLTATVSPSLSGTITYEFFGITPTTYSQYIRATQNGNQLNFEGLKEYTGINVRARAKVPVEGMENTWVETDAATGSATINITSPTFNTLGTIYANEGLNVNLAKFINNGSGGGVNVTAVSSSGGYISNETTLPALAKNVNLKGKKSGTNTNDVSVTASGVTKTANVVVYPKPSLSVSDSGSGSSLKYTFKLTVPKAVYDGTTVISDVDKAVLEFKGKKDTYVYDESISLESDGDLKKKNKDTISIDIKKLTEIFDKVCEDDSEEVKVTTYVKGDKNCISDEHKIHVYKIKLDGSAGADYKINGESKSDKFYAIKDKSYEISTTPKSGYNGTPTKWDGTSFGTSSSGTTSFSESKTVKAYYTGGSSSSSSSKSTALNSAATGDDYDDVPKTGESKADIWILWSVLFISILGAGFMIWKRFGLVRAIAEAEEEVAIAEREERIEAEAKEKQEKIDMLKNLRNL